MIATAEIANFIYEDSSGSLYIFTYVKYHTNYNAFLPLQSLNAYGLKDIIMHANTEVE